MMQQFRYFSLFLLLLFGFGFIFGQTVQETHPYWVFFKEKGTQKQFQPENIFSAKALARRQKHEIAFDHRDYPVNQDFISQIETVGGEIRVISRWLNAVSVNLTFDELVVVQSLPFVKKVETLHKRKPDLPQNEHPASAQKVGGYHATYTQNQLSLVGLDYLHASGFTGKGITIAIMDSGFDDIDQNPGMSHLFDRGAILEVRDFVDNDGSVYEDHWHGANVFTILAGYIENQYIGAATGADFMLLRTENTDSETNLEEDSWVAAAEYAEANGADIFSTSLGYSEMDTLWTSYFPSDMDGNTTIITRAADIAASRGILVINSAGNEGNNSNWNIITAPADGDSVLAVGAVNENGELAGFSSRGPTADGRTKPDLCAVGWDTYYINQSGNIYQGSGTSYSCPMMAGLAACVWQANPDLSNWELFQLLKSSADRYTDPDNNFGYGIPNGRAAFLEAAGVDDTFSQLNESGIAVYPNPAGPDLSFSIDYPETADPVTVRLVDAMGNIILEQIVVPDNPAKNEFTFVRGVDFKIFNSGIYTFQVIDKAQEKPRVFSRRVLFLN